MATLNNTRISDTYFGLIKTIDNAVISATLKELSDGSGNATGLSINNAGDFKVNSVLEFGSLKDTGENIVISKFVDAADGIGNNNNDTSIPTSAAVVSYVAAQITAEDLDFTGDDASVAGDVDLNSEQFRILGTANEIETSVVSAGGNQLRIGIVNNPTLTGIVTATTFSGDLNGTINTATTAVTQSAGDNSTKVATTAYVDTLDAASDLDFSGDSGTGDVTLNTQTFAVTGTTNQITTSASGQTLNLSLPSTVHRNIQGNVTGNLTGNVTGNVSGDLTGNVTATSVLANGVTATTQLSSDSSTKVATTAYVKGLDNASDLDITDGSNTGDVNLNTQSLSILGTSQQVTSTVSNQSVTLSLPSSINVNSASATILQNARDISLTGQATATISSFNGSSNVSGAVTLDNNSVTGKVLTGLASPTASNILASDSILQAFGKAQSQINTLAGGLRFMGTWNATTNSPTLASGGGEADSGTTTGTATNKLIDSSQNFTSTITNGDQVVNQASGSTALVTNVDSNTQLTLDADIMVSGQEYTIDNSPFLSQGHYFVVSVGGTQSLNGLSNWAVGDWVIAGANNTWEKLDHTQVDGTGTTGNITKWESTNVIADSIMAESGSTISVTGSLSTSQLLSSGGNFAVNTDKFTANATTGDVALAGGLTIGTKGLISIISGNNITISGTDADHSGLSFATNAILPAVVSATNSGVVDLGATSERFKGVYAVFGNFSQSSTSDPVLSLSDTGVADYDFTFPDTGTIQLGVNTSSTKTLKLINAGSGLFGLEVNGSTTVTGEITTQGNITVKSDGSNGNKFVRIWNEGTAANDDALISWQTQGSRTYSMGIHRDSGSLVISNADNSVASGDLININATGNVGISTINAYAFDTTATKFHVKNDAGAGNIAEVARFEGSSDASGSAAVIRLGTSNDRGIYIQAGRTGAVPYGAIGTTEYDGTKTETIFINSDKSVEFKGEISVKSAQDTSFDEGIGVIRSNSAQTGYINMVGGAMNINAPNAIPIKFRDGGNTNLTIGGDGAATFAGSVNITGGTTNGLNITTSGTQDTIKIDRAATSDNAITKYQTASADKWIVGLRNTGDDNFRFYNYGTSSDSLVIDTSGTIIGTGTYSGGGSVKIFEAQRSGGAVKSDWDYHDSSPIRMSIGTSTSHSFAIKTADTPRLGIANTGNITIGNFTSSGTPYSDYHAVEIGRQGNTIIGAPWKSNLYLSCNATITAGSTQYTYRYASEAANRFDLEDGQFVFANAPAGTAGANITWNERMKIALDGTIISTKDGAGLQTNLLLANLNDTDGDTAGIGFSMLDNGTYIKSGIYFERTTTQGRGDLIFAMNDTVDGQNVALADEAMRIGRNKVVEIGSSTAQSNSKLDVRNNGSAIEFGHTNNGDWYFGTVGSFGSNGQPMITFSTFCEQSANTFTTKGAKGNIITADANGTLFFQQVTSTNTTGQTPSTVMTLYDGGRLHPSGGIFLGSSNNSNLLDDYEEGNWTPQIYYQNSTDQGNSTNTTQTGIYTKVGRKVTVMFRLIWEITGTPATDNIGIGNLPFNGQSISNNSTYAEVPCTIKGYSNPSTGGRGSLTLTLPNNNSDKALFNDSNLVGNMGGVIGAGTHEIRFTFTYTTDQ